MARNWRLVRGLGLGAVLGLIFLVVQYFEWAAKPFGLASIALLLRSTLLITGFHMAHVVVGFLMLLALTFWSGRGYFNRVRYRPYPYRRALLAFRRCGVVGGVLHLLHHAFAGVEDMSLSSSATRYELRHPVNFAALLFGACTPRSFGSGS